MDSPAGSQIKGRILSDTAFAIKSPILPPSAHVPLRVSEN